MASVRQPLSMSRLLLAEHRDTASGRSTSPLLSSPRMCSSCLPPLSIVERWNRVTQNDRHPVHATDFCTFLERYMLEEFHNMLCE